MTLLSGYIDDKVITGNDFHWILALKNSLKRNFMVKDLGRLKHFLRIEVSYLKKTFSFVNINMQCIVKNI